MGAENRSIEAGFLSREPSLSCPRPGCTGVIDTASRELRRSLAAGTGSAVVLRCDGPGAHVHTLRLAPLAPEEQDGMRSEVRAGREPACARCGTRMEKQRVDLPGGAGSGERAIAYACSWCGVRWTPRGRVRWSEDPDVADGA